MSLPEKQARVKAKIWQAVAQSGVNTSAIPQEEMDKLVNAVTDGVLQEMDALLGEEVGPARQAAPPSLGGLDEEQVLWEGRPFLSLGVTYQITTERVRLIEGILGKSRDDIELVRIQDLDQTQSLTERMLNIGDIHIRSQDRSRPELVLNNVSNPQEVHEVLRRAVLDARKRHGVAFREQM
jgi:hypothetical protein